MIIRYAPTGQDPREWTTFRPGELESVEAEAIEEATGWSHYEWTQKLLEGFARAKRAALWVLLRRDDPTLDFDSLSYRQEDLWVGFDAEEMRRLRAALDAGLDGLPSRRRSELIELLDAAEGADTLPEVADPGDALPELQSPVPEGKDTAGVDASVNGT